MTCYGRRKLNSAKFRLLEIRNFFFPEIQSPIKKHDDCKKPCPPQALQQSSTPSDLSDEDLCSMWINGWIVCWYIGIVLRHETFLVLIIWRRAYNRVVMIKYWIILKKND